MRMRAAGRRGPAGVLAAMLLGLGGCSGSGRETYGNWREALQAVQPRQAIYSPAFEGAPPEGQFLRLSFHPGQDTGGACGRYGEDTSSTSDFWYLLLTLNGSAPGDYTLVPDLRGHEDAAHASVRVIHVKDWKPVEDYAAVGGTLNLQQAPAAAEDFRSGARLSGSLQAEFPEHPLRQVECSGEVQPGGPARMWCTCEDEAGQTSECVSDGTNCCHAVDGARVPFEMSFEAAPCASMCVAPPNLLSYCDALRP